MNFGVLLQPKPMPIFFERYDKICTYLTCTQKLTGCQLQPNTQWKTQFYSTVFSRWVQPSCFKPPTSTVKNLRWLQTFCRQHIWSQGVRRFINRIIIIITSNTDVQVATRLRIVVSLRCVQVGVWGQSPSPLVWCHHMRLTVVQNSSGRQVVWCRQTAALEQAACFTAVIWQSLLLPIQKTVENIFLCQGLGCNA